MFWKKQKEIEKAVKDYLAEIENCISAFAEAFEIYFAQGLGEQFEKLAEKTHRYESSSDDKHREIEQTMYGKALIPSVRGDILGMLEALDQIPNKCESVLYQICLQNMSIPEEHIKEFKNIVRVNIESYRSLSEAIHHLFNDISQVRPSINQVDAKESESDNIERRIIKSLFNSSLDKADKILLKELCLEIGAISDRAENAGDRINIIAIKQQT